MIRSATRPRPREWGEESIASTSLELAHWHHKTVVRDIEGDSPNWPLFMWRGGMVPTLESGCIGVGCESDET